MRWSLFASKELLGFRPSEYEISGLNAWNRYCCKLSIASEERIPRKEEKPLLAGKFSDKKGHANEKRFSRHRSSAPWDGGGDGPIALRERGRFRQICPQIARASPLKSRAAGFCPNRFSDQHGDPLPVESKHRDNGVLGWRASRRE